jgi:hypothetical protein
VTQNRSGTATLSLAIGDLGKFSVRNWLAGRMLLVRQGSSGVVLLAVVTALMITVAACGRDTPATPTHAQARIPLPDRPTPVGSASSTGSYSKVMVIVEENKSYAEVMQAGRAPFIEHLAARYASAQAMDAGYPVGCPSLAAHLLMTSGDRGGICDDEDPSEHPRSGPSIFSQVAGTGREWRGYAESMPHPCARTNSGLYLVRHAPAPYYLSESGRCDEWDVPLGALSSGALHDDIRAGNLPAYAMVTPNACNDMHGATGCASDQIATGDAWLAQWVPVILAGPDYRAGRLILVITFDEGSATDNRIPTLVIAPTANHRVVTQPVTHCSMLRLAEETLELPLLGCAADVPSPRTAFGVA